MPATSKSQTSASRRESATARPGRYAELQIIWPLKSSQEEGMAKVTLCVCVCVYVYKAQANSQFSQKAATSYSRLMFRRGLVDGRRANLRDDRELHSLLPPKPTENVHVVFASHVTY